MPCICQCHVITDGEARHHAKDIVPEKTPTRSGAQIFRAACNGSKGCGGCNANFEKLAEQLIAEGWKPAALERE